MKTDKYYILLIFFGFVVLMSTTLLLELDFFSRTPERRIIIDLFIILQLYILFKKLFKK